MATDHVPTRCARYEKASELMGKRWTGLILRILLAGPQRFSGLSEAIGTISERVLSERLKELEAEGVVSRHVDAGPPIRVAYQLTEKGQALWKVVDELEKWADRWVDMKPVPSARKRRSA